MKCRMRIGLEEAQRLTRERVLPLPAETLPLNECVDRVAAGPVAALVDSPSVDASLKDGFAVIAAEIAAATTQKPVHLQLIGTAAAGDGERRRVRPGQAVRVLSGARIPEGANAVVAEEFTAVVDGGLEVRTFAEPGRNILPRGCDIAAGEPLLEPGTTLTPGMVGLLAAAGHHQLPVFRLPKVAIVATGDEVVAPGRPLAAGKLYASNLATLDAWCRRYRMRTETVISSDQPAEIRSVLSALAGRADALLTSGGAWTGDRDRVAAILSELGWDQVFHRIRIGPGKAVGFGLLENKPVFILPGGPPSNVIGFLEIALPGLMRMAGSRDPGLPSVAVRLAVELVGADSDWTQFFFGRLEPHQDIPLFVPLLGASRLGSMAGAEAIVAIPEGSTHLPAGSIVAAQTLM